MASCLVIIIAWAVAPLLDWSIASAGSLAGFPMLVTGVPQLTDALTQLLVPGALVAAAAVIAAVRLRSPERIAGWTIAGVLGAVGAHSLYKHVFAIADSPAF